MEKLRLKRGLTLLTLALLMASWFSACKSESYDSVSHVEASKISENVETETDSLTREAKSQVTEEGAKDEEKKLFSSSNDNQNPN